MSTILEKPISVNRTLATSLEHAKAIEDPARAKILQMLYRKHLNAEQITNQLKKNGFKKALTTTRHHLEILKGAELIEVVKIEEKRGAMIKYYGTSTKLLDYETPKDFEKKYSTVIKSTSKHIEQLLDGLSKKTGKAKPSQSKQEYSQYLMMEIVNRAVTTVFEKRH
jgi:DNA-binding transcriptional ArsR family regulator